MRRAGFTLIELLVAMVIALMLAGLLLSVTSNLLGTWQRTQGHATSAITAKLVLDQLERDLQSAITRNDGNQWIDARILGTSELDAHGWEFEDSVIQKPHAESIHVLPSGHRGIADAKFGRSGIWLRLVTSDYDSELKASAPRAVAYQIVRRSVSTEKEAPLRYNLYRTIMSAEDTFDDVLGTGYATSAVPDEFVKPGRGEVIANNVVDFGVWISNRDSNGVETPLYPVSNSEAALAGYVNHGVIWVMVRILTEEGADRLESMENGNVLKPSGLTAAHWWWQEVATHSRVFCRRIELKGQQI